MIYTIKLLECFKMNKSNPISIPILVETILKMTKVDLLAKDDIIIYRQVVESVLYFTNNTRLDIIYIIDQLVYFISKPTKVYYQHTYILLQYLNRIRDLNIIYLNWLEELSRAYNIFIDITWSMEDNRKSIQGWAHIRYKGVIN